MGEAEKLPKVEQNSSSSSSETKVVSVTQEQLEKVQDDPAQQTSEEPKLEKTVSRLSLQRKRTNSTVSFDAGPENDDDVTYPHGLKLALVTLSLCLAVFLVALDNTIIATAIPKITDQFNSLSDVGWYGSSYLLTTCALQLFFGKSVSPRSHCFFVETNIGRLYTFYSIKWVYLASIFTFEVGSAICGAAPSSEALIVGRAIAGLGSAGLFSGSLVIIAYTVPIVKRPAYMGIVGAMYGIASVVGPLLGGAFTDGPGWRWCFYINLPLGAITLAVIFFFFTSPQRKQEQKVSFAERVSQLDLGGTALFIVAIVCILLALQWGGSTYPWHNWRIILLFVIFGVLIIAFVVLQWYMGDYATIPFRIISQRSIAAACVWAVFLGGAFFVLVYWVPIWFQAIKQASALKSGIMLIPMILTLVIATIVSGIVTTKLGYYNPFYIASFIFASIGSGLLTTWTIDTGASKWIGYQIIYGFGIGFGMQQPIVTVQAVLPLKDVPVGSAMVTFFQIFGGSLFVSAAQNIFNNRLISEIVQNVPGVDPQIVTHVGATNLARAIPPQFFEGVQKAYNTALTETWYISVALSCLSAIPALLVEWKSVKGQQPTAAAA